MSDDYVSLTYDRVVHRTEKAVLLRFGDREEWIPLSQIEDPDWLDDEDNGEVGVAYWLVEERGLEGYES